MSNIVANGSLSSCASSRWGIYEKALPAGLTWDKMLEGATAAGYQFLEISIDESDERLRRLEWPRAARRDLHAALNSAEASIDSMCLSAHRKYSLGSSSKPRRERGLTIMKRAIDFAAEFGLRIVQVAGYDVFYEESTDMTRGMYLEAILQAAAWARESCVMLGLENVDCPVADSVTKALRFVKAAGTPWFQLYPDVANLAATGHDPSNELRAGGSHIVGLHLKDGRLGEIRRVPFGDGIVDFGAVFRTLSSLAYCGPFVVEMWNDEESNAFAAAALARIWLAERLAGTTYAKEREVEP